MMNHKFTAFCTSLTTIFGRPMSAEDVEVVSKHVETLQGTNKYIDASLVAGLVSACSRGYKIEAIKEIRTLTGWGLKESKDFVEANWNIKQQQPW